MQFSMFQPLQSAFADDLAVLAPLVELSSDPSLLLPQLAEMPSKVVNTLHSRGMVVNAKPGKSGLLVSLVGPRSRLAKRALIGRESISAGGISIQLVDSYLHVGDVINASGTMYAACDQPSLNASWNDLWSFP